jgi:peptidoglycan/xylan/chitin deacetylase (PgdA/CDA1 family)
MARLFIALIAGAGVASAVVAASTASTRIAPVPPLRPVPVLMFHAIGDPSPGALPELYLRPGTFRAQMAWLAARGYRAVTLDAVWRHWTQGRPLPRRPIVLSFDDGHPSHVQIALPVLRRLGWPGVLNLRIGNLSPANVRLLIGAGWEIDSHTFNHPDLTSVGPHQLEREVAGSRRWLRKVLGVPANFFCYPSGRYDESVVAAVRRAGYLGATTTVEGLSSPADGMWTLRRVRVNRSDGIAGLAAKLRVRPPSRPRR